MKKVRIILKYVFSELIHSDEGLGVLFSVGLEEEEGS